MAKAKYKIGNLVKFTTARGFTTGTVSGILTTEQGFSYQMEDDASFTPESDIITAFREIKPRATKTVRAAKKSKKTTETHVTQ